MENELLHAVVDALGMRYEIPMSYIYAGTELVITNGEEVMRAVADMDGHYVSPTYGARQDPGRAGYFHDNPTTNYINVRLPSLQPEARRRAGDNLTLYQREGWRLFAGTDAYNLYCRDWDKDLRKEKDKKKLAIQDARDELKRAQAALRLAEKKLDNIR